MTSKSKIPATQAAKLGFHLEGEIRAEVIRLLDLNPREPRKSYDLARKIPQPLKGGGIPSAAHAHLDGDAANRAVAETETIVTEYGPHGNLATQLEEIKETNKSRWRAWGKVAKQARRMQELLSSESTNLEPGKAWDTVMLLENIPALPINFEMGVLWLQMLEILAKREERLLGFITRKRGRPPTPLLGLVDHLIRLFRKYRPEYPASAAQWKRDLGDFLLFILQAAGIRDEQMSDERFLRDYGPNGQNSRRYRKGQKDLAETLKAGLPFLAAKAASSAPGAEEAQYMLDLQTQIVENIEREGAEPNTPADKKSPR